MFPLSRREFLKGSALLAASAAAIGTLGDDAEAQQQNNTTPPGSNERINVAVIGLGGRGPSHIQGLAGRDNCVVTHVCDCDTSRANRAISSAAQRQNNQRPEFVQDLRRILDNRDVHVVTIATPNHWHSLAAIWAMQAGKDVYVEKPVSHNVYEGRRAVEVARLTNRICQVGTQARSSQALRQAMAFLREGRLGRIEVARGLCYKPRGSIGQTTGEQQLPSTVDYNLWCGPAPMNPLRRRNLHYDWHWVWDTGNGDLGNQGIHQMDIARWALNKNDLGRNVLSVGGRFGYRDDGETANTQVCVYNYGDCSLLFEVRGLSTPRYRGVAIGNVIHCADGYMTIPDSYNSAVAYDRDGGVIQRFNGSGDHYANFIRAVRSRRVEDLNADVLEGHLSSALCHLGNISYRLGTEERFGNRTDVLGDDRWANDTYASMVEHLRANRVDMNDTMYKMGRSLTLNPETERFVNNEEANRMLTREYRHGFVVPASI